MRLTKKQRAMLSRSPGNSESWYIWMNGNRKRTVASLFRKRLLRVDHSADCIKLTDLGRRELHREGTRCPECGERFGNEGQCIVGCVNH